MKTDVTLKSLTVKLIVRTLRLFVLASMLMHYAELSAQTVIRHYFDEKKNRYIGFRGSVQFWGRYTSFNPGSLVDGEVKDGLWDFSMRRYRMQLYGRLSERMKFTFETGNNNLNYYQRDVWPKVLDASIEYKISDHVNVGIGKSGWTGLSRYAAPGTSTALGYDISFLATPFMNVYDDLLRRWGIYGHGGYKAWDYRVVISKPYRNAVSGFLLSDKAEFSCRYTPLQTSLYAKYQFYDKESLDSPFSPGTYLGEKRILNVGAGILYQPDATAKLIGGDTIYYDARLFAIDLFYEVPVNRKNLITFYVAYFKSNLGPDFVRSMGANNPANGGIATDYFNGPGNSTPVSGTGNLFNVQLAFLKPFQVSKNVLPVQAFGSMDYGTLHGLDDAMILWNAGISYFIRSHSSKFTVGYQNRPVFRKLSDDKIKEDSRKVMIVLQYQFKVG